MLPSCVEHDYAHAVQLWGDFGLNDRLPGCTDQAEICEQHRRGAV